MTLSAVYISKLKTIEAIVTVIVLDASASIESAEMAAAVVGQTHLAVLTETDQKALVGRGSLQEINVKVTMGIIAIISSGSGRTPGSKRGLPD